MNKNLYILLMAFSSYQLYSELKQPNTQQPDFKDPIHLFDKRDLIEQLKLQQEAEKEFTDQPTVL